VRAGVTFTGTAALPETRFALPAGDYVVSVLYSGPAGTNMRVVLAVVGTFTAYDFIVGPTTTPGLTSLKVPEDGDVTLAVEASGPWRITIFEKTEP
jgi:hypothetical protein